MEFAAKEKLEIVNVRGFAAIFCPPFNPSRAPRGEEIPFELSLKYTARKTCGLVGFDSAKKGNSCARRIPPHRYWHMAHKVINKISSEAVEKAMGKGWDEWIRILDKEGAKEKPHKEIAKMLSEKGYIKRPKGWPASRSFSVGWWCQMVTVGYEYAKGRRTVGETAATGYEIGAQKAFPITRQKAWKFMMSPNGVEGWLGNVKNWEPTPGKEYKTSEGVTGQIRTISKNNRLRLTWKLPKWKSPSTLQVSFIPIGKKTAIHFHQEKLSGSKVREEMRKHWREVLQRLEKSIGK